MADMSDILKKVQDMQKNFGKIQGELEAIRAEGSSGGGMVKVVCTGKQDIISVNIDPAIVDLNDLSMLEDLVAAAVNDAIKNSRVIVEKEMGALTKGLF